MVMLRWAQAALAAALACQTSALKNSGLPGMKIKVQEDYDLQHIVTWDQHSLFVHGERIMFYSGEFHPFRLPVPGLWLDVFQKIRALGYTGVSFYTDWALLEGTPGTFRAEGIFDLDPFFAAAKQAGIYLLARPGPYINAEASGGGFPGWLQGVPGTFRTIDPAYIKATEVYVQGIGSIIAKNQITNGGPIILMQPENEYYDCASSITPCPNSTYMGTVEQQFRNQSVVVPYIVNDDNEGHFAPGTPAAVEIYGIDDYPLGFDCATPDIWPNDSVQDFFASSHLQLSPTTPFAIVEFQGGSFDFWGGPGFAKCAELLGASFESVFYKNNLGFAIGFFSIYMTYGGTNWGNIGMPGGYTSYDYGAVIAENLLVTRDKYSEAKLIANFVQASPTYLTSTAGNLTTSKYTTTSALAVTPLIGNGSDTNMYVIRHTNGSSLATTNYSFKVSTSKGAVTVPQLGGSLTLNGRDSKIYVTDYKVGLASLLYSTAEIFTWSQYGDRSVLIVYANPGEENEIALLNTGKITITPNKGFKTKTVNGTMVINWTQGTSRTVIKTASGLTIYLVDRQAAYNYWVLKLPNEQGLYAPQLNATTVIVNAGYLMRNATVSGSTLNLVGDFNKTTTVEILGGAPSKLSQLNINGKSTKFTQTKSGIITATVEFTQPNAKIPDLATLDWKYIDTLPEIQSTYDDSLWPKADLKHTKDDRVNLTTPTSLIASDYGFVTGVLLYRGHFTANGNENSFSMTAWGGDAFGYSIYINDTFVGADHGTGAAGHSTHSFTVPKLKKGSNYVMTVVLDTTGYDENYVVGMAGVKNPRGITRYSLSGHKASDITWKITGNLHGLDYEDKVRGPLNEGGLWAERHGYHLPGAPINKWQSSKGPTGGLNSTGVAFYGANFDLDLPSGYNFPLSVTFTNASSSSGTAPAYRCIFFVNGYQFGKYVNNIGPQTSFPVHEGIWNFHGSNYISMALWSMEPNGAKVPDLKLSLNGTVLSGYGDIPMAPMSKYHKRAGVY